MGTADQHHEPSSGDPVLDLRNHVHQLPGILWTTDRDLRIVEYYGAGLKSLGINPGEYVGATLYDYLQTDDPTHPTVAAHLRALRGDTVRLDREWHGRYLEGYLSPLKDDQEKIIGTIGMTFDVTERRLAELELQRSHQELEQQLNEDQARHREVARRLEESERRLRLFMDTVPIPVVVSRRKDTTILYANPRFRDALGVNPTEMIGRSSLSFYVDPADRERLLNQLDREGMVQNYEVRVRRPDGKMLWVTMSMQPITYEGDECILGGLVDLTARKEAEQMLLRERRLLKRLLDLHERDRQLIAYEIHDGIVQDMTGASMFFEAARHQLSEGRAEDADESLNGGMRLLRGSIDEARRLIRGLRPPVLEEEGMVPAIQNLIQEITSASGLEIEFVHQLDCDRLAPALEVAVYRVVQEALNNVWRHSRSPKAQVRLEQSGEQLGVMIRDWGVGFDPLQVKKKRYGLVGVRERARLLGGTASIESQPGSGVTIRVQLPLTDVPGPPQDDGWRGRKDEEMRG